MLFEDDDASHFERDADTPTPFTKTDFYSALQLIAAVRQQNHPLIIEEPKPRTLRLLDAIAFALTPDGKNPTAVAVDYNSKEILVARNKPVTESEYYMSNFHLLLRLYFKLAVLKDSEEAYAIEIQLFRNTVRFCYERVLKRCTKLSRFLRDVKKWGESPFYNATEDEEHVNDIKNLAREMATEEAREKNDPNLACAEALITNCFVYAEEVLLPRQRKLNQPIDAFVRRIAKVGEFAGQISRILRGLSLLALRPVDDPERQLLDSTFVELPLEGAQKVTGLTREAGVEALGLGEDEWDYIWKNVQFVEGLALDKSEMWNGGFVEFGSEMVVERHPEMRIIDELISRNVYMGPIGVSSLCCYACYTTLILLDGWAISGCNQRVSTRWKLPDTAALTDTGSTLLDLWGKEMGIEFQALRKLEQEKEEKDERERVAEEEREKAEAEERKTIRRQRADSNPTPEGELGPAAVDIRRYKELGAKRQPSIIFKQ
ncbi:hypothetical protein HK104_007583 [Borealophlyctis nickersoniae]|nr:hypothetical protein HK104_007583 [Borealophlyctis nickersoniae]